MTNFSDLGLNPELLKALESEGYAKPTPIQTQAIPPLLQGRDLLGIAQTGTGKTAAFALPILHRLAADRKAPARKTARCLVLSPTRELASQIAESFRTYGKHLGLTVTTVFGGVGHRPQMQALLRGVDVVVATPGRLIDHMNEGNILLASTEVLVLDEADRMMDLGFIKPLRQIISKLSSKRQSMFFSATMPQEIGSLAAELLRDPYRVSVTPVAKTADRVAQKVIYVEQQKKRALLVELFGDDAMTRTLIFTRTKRGADRVARHLEGAGIPVAAIHGNKSQGQREAALAAFKNDKIRALVATDIAARGIDVDEVSHVVNFEIPNIPESYVHRIGRTARAGAEGIAISLVDNEERVYLKDIEKLTRQQIPSEDRRNDAGLKADERTPHEKHNGDRRRDGGRGDSRGRQHAGGRGGPSKPRTHGDRAGRPAHAERPARGEHASRGEHTARAERPDRSERPAHSERPRHNHERPSHRGGEHVSELAFGSMPSRPHGDKPKRDPEFAGEARRGGDHGPRKPHGNGDRRQANGDRRPGSSERPRHGSGHARSETRGEGRPHRDHNEHRTGDRGREAAGADLSGVRFLGGTDHQRRPGSNRPHGGEQNRAAGNRGGERRGSHGGQGNKSSNYRQP